MIYLDNAATTRVFDEAVEEMAEFYSEEYFNPSALYCNAQKVRSSLERAREVIAGKLGASKEEIFFTSCATESNNWVLGSGRKYKKGNIVTTMGEHPSAYETAMMLGGKGVDVKFAKLAKDGRVDEDDLFEKVNEETALVSIIHCSNETGAINDLEKIIKRIRSVAPRALVHSDGVQAFCKLDTNLRELDVDFYSVSAHKVGGTKGVGALYINKRNNIAPFIYGGGQERGGRSGTENVAGIIGFAKAVEIFNEKAASFDAHDIYTKVTSRLESLTGVKINGSKENNSGYIISASIDGIRAEVLQHMLSDDGVLIGLGSACSAKSRQNRVLSSMGRNGKEIEGSIRISFSVEIKESEAINAVETIIDKIIELRARIGN